MKQRTICNFQPWEIERTEEETECSPFVFAIDFSYRKIDTMAGIWEAVGAETKIVQTGAGYALILDLSETEQ